MSDGGKGYTQEVKTSTSAAPVETVKRSPVIFMTSNSQSDGLNTLKRMSFEMGGIEYTLILNPEEYTQSEPNRVTVTQTKGGSYIDEFGSGVPTLTMRGTTGFKNGTSNPTVGFSKFKELRDLMRRYMDGVQPGQPIPAGNELIFHNYTDGEHWVVTPKVFTLMRSVSRSLLYLYDIQLAFIRRADIPAPEEVAQNIKLVAELPGVEVRA